jgi:hypothetical protein
MNVRNATEGRSFFRLWGSIGKIPARCLENVTFRMCDAISGCSRNSMSKYRIIVRRK